jgi:hypothetical protein
MRLARIAGVLYLLVAICGGFAHFYSRGAVYVAGNATETADRVAENATAVRLGVVADLVQATIFLFLAMTLYVLLRHVNDNVARAMVTIVAVAVAMICLNMVHQFGALLVATDASYQSAFGPETADALTLLMLDLQKYGYLAAQIFFGLWLLPLGYLTYRSGVFPRPLGVVLGLGCVAYLVDTFARFLLTDVNETLATIVILPAAIGELWMVGYLLIRGMKVRGMKVRQPQAVSPVAAINRQPDATHDLHR